jgi:hypothetical protein
MPIDWRQLPPHQEPIKRYLPTAESERYGGVTPEPFFGLDRTGGINRKPWTRWFSFRVWLLGRIRRLLNVPAGY